MRWNNETYGKAFITTFESGCFGGVREIDDSEQTPDERIKDDWRLGSVLWQQLNWFDCFMYVREPSFRWQSVFYVHTLFFPLGRPFF